MGKTETEIFDALHIDTADIVDGSSETLHQFWQDVYQRIVRVRYDESAQLMKDIDVKNRKHLTGPDVEPEYDLFKCALLDQYFIPLYKFNAITIKGFLLTFYKNKLVRIRHDLISDYSEEDNLRESLFNLLSLFQHQDTSYYNNQHRDDYLDKCYDFHFDEWNEWPKTKSEGGLRVKFNFASYCGIKNEMLSIFLEIVDKDFLKEMETVCPDIDDN